MEAYVESSHKILPQADDCDSGHWREAQPRSLGFIKAITHSELPVISFDIAQFTTADPKAQAVRS